MLNKLFSKCGYFFILSLSSLAMAQQASCSSSCNENNPIFVWGSFLYWQPIQENMKLGVLSDASNDLDIVNGREIDLDYEYKPGFVVGIGYNFKGNTWDTALQYTYFRATEHVHKGVDPNSSTLYILPAWQFPSFLNPHYNSASEKWKLRLDFLDWDFALKCVLNDRVIMRPFLGIRGALIDQSVHVRYINSNASNALIFPSTYVYDSSRSWGIGPRFGLYSQATFSNGFRIFATQEIDVLYSQYDLKAEQRTDQTSANRYLVQEKNANYLKTHLDLDVGIGWGTCFANSFRRIDFSLDYRFQVFFSQNTFRNTLNDKAVGSAISPNGNLYLSGVTATVRLEF